MNTTQQKGISLVIFFFTTLMAGSVPIFLFVQCRGRVSSRRGQTIISLLNCFAGGVFLATCLLNLLVEGFEEYEEFKNAAGFDSEYPFFHLGIGAGFFAVAFFERIAVVLSTTSSEKKAGKEAANQEGVRTGDTGQENKMFELMHKHTSANSSGGVPPSPGGSLEESAVPGSRAAGTESIPEYVPASPPKGCDASPPKGWDASPPKGWDGERGGATSSVEEGTERFTGHSKVIALTIFLALSFHTIFDGLAVGLQETEADVWTTTIAISIHKTIVAVSLGLELASASPNKLLKPLLFLAVFALMAPLGVAIGMGVTSSGVDERAHLLAGGVLQGVATGSFLYVTFFEVLGEELGRRSSVLKILMTVLGFGVMAVAKIWDTD